MANRTLPTSGFAGNRHCRQFESQKPLINKALSDSETSTTYPNISSFDALSSCRFVLCLAACSFCLLSIPRVAKAQSAHHQRFVEALKDNGYFDVAENYLEQASNSDWLSNRQKAALPFQKSALAFEKAKQLRSSKEILAAWNAAEATAEEYLRGATDFDSKLKALKLLRQIEEGKAGRILKRAKLDRNSIWKKPEDAAEVRTHFQNAASYFDQSVEVLRTHLKAIRSSTDKKLRATFAGKSEKFLRFLLLRNAHLENAAISYAPNSPERKKKLEALVNSYESLAKKYYSRPPYNEYFRAYKGRCLANLGRWKEGARELEDVFLRTEPSFLTLQTSLIPSAIECWKNQTPPVVEPALTHLNNIVSRIPSDQSQVPSNELAVYYLAKTYREKFDTLSKIEKPNSTQRKELRSAEKKSEDLLKTLRKSKTQAGSLARELILASGGKVKALVEGPPENFAEAFSRASDQFRSAVKVFQANSKTEPIPPALSAQVDQTLKALDIASRMADESTTADEKNLIRYYRCYCFWIKRRYQETALMGEFMLRRFSNQKGTSESVSLATQAYHRQILVGQKANKDVSFERERLSDLCKQVLKKWPNSNAAGDVSFQLLSAAIGQNNLEDVRTAADQIPTSHSKFSAGQLFSGLSIYNQSITQKQELKKQTDDKSLSEEQIRSKQREIDSLQAEAIARFEKSMQTLTSTPTSQYYDAANKLASYWNTQKKYSQAYQLLSSSPLSTFDRIKSDAKLKLSDPLKVLLIRNGLIGTLSDAVDSGNVSESLGQTNRLMELLQKYDSADPKVGRFVSSAETVVLIRLGQLAKIAKNNQDRTLIAEACLKYFQTLPAKRNDFRAIGTLGTTLQSISDALGSGSINLRKKLNSLAAQCYEKSIRLAGNSTDGKRYVLQFQLGMAATLRGEGKYEKAAKEIEKILIKNSRLAPAQIEACKIYQQWGERTRNVSHIQVAMRGGVKKKVGRKTKHLVQGWKNLAQSTIGNKKNSNIFYESFIGLAQCKLSIGVLKGDTDFYKSTLKQIAKEKRRSPELGGPVFQNQIDQITRRTQKLLGIPQSGLSGL